MEYCETSDLETNLGRILVDRVYTKSIHTYVKWNRYYVREKKRNQKCIFMQILNYPNTSI